MRLGREAGRRASCGKIRKRRSTMVGLETRPYRDAVTLAKERASQQGTQTSTKPTRQFLTIPGAAGGENSSGRLANAIDAEN
jgi:hypothetical protein